MVIIDLHVSLSTCSVCVFDTLLFTLMWSRLREACVWNPVVFLCKNPPFASEENPQFASQQNPPFANEENPQFASEENPQFENEENPQFAKEENQQFANEKIHNLQIRQGIHLQRCVSCDDMDVSSSIFGLWRNLTKHMLTHHISLQVNM